MPKANTLIDAANLPIEMAAVPPADVVSGSPEAGSAELVNDAGVSVGVWEITPGVVTDVEVAESFVVLSGVGTLQFDGDESILQLRPGSFVQLAAGSRTRWTITETLRKLYVIAEIETL